MKAEKRRVGEKQVQQMMLYNYAKEQRNSGNKARTPLVNPIQKARYNLNTRNNVSTAMYLKRDMDTYKKESRVGNSTINEIRKKAEREARKSVRGR